MLSRLGPHLRLLSVSAFALGACGEPAHESQARVDVPAGSYYLPRISPSGRQVAFVNADSSAHGPSAQLLVLDVGRSVVDTILTADDLWRFATYSAHVISLAWIGDETLEVSVSDGDVDVTKLTVGIRSGIQATEAIEPGIDAWPIPAADTLGTLYPHVRPDSTVEAASVFSSALSWPGTFRSPNSVVLQIRYSRMDNDVWLYRLDTLSATRLQVLPRGHRYTLSGGMFWGDDVIFGTGSDTAFVYLWRGGRLKALFSAPSAVQQHRLLAVRSMPDCAWLLLRPGIRADRARAIALLFDGTRVQQAFSNLALTDFDVDPTGRFVAATFVVPEGTGLSVIPLASACVA